MSSASANAIPYRASSVLLAATPQVSDPPKTLGEVLAWGKPTPGGTQINGTAPALGPNGTRRVAVSYWPNGRRTSRSRDS